MANRTYLPKLLRLLRITCKYMKRWETFIRDHLPDEAAQTAFSNVLVACEALEAIVELLIPSET